MQPSQQSIFARAFISPLLSYALVISLFALLLTRRALASPAGKTNPGKSQRMFKCLLQAGATFLLFSAMVVAQQQISHGPTDNGVTTAFSSTYAGGYPVSGIDTVNLYNGRVSLNLPLGKIGARGSVGYSPAISISRTFVLRTYQTWTLAGSQVTFSDPKYKVISEGYMDSYDYSNFQPGLLPAVIIGRRTRDTSPNPAPGAPAQSCFTLTKLYLRLAGAEIELRDATGYNGEPHYNAPTAVFNRGKEWHSVDGAGILFVSDTDISDETCMDNGFAAMNGINMIYPTGYLKMEDGTRYRFVQGFPVWMRDRNGNTITFTGSQNAPDVTDSIGRKYHLLYGSGTNTYSPTGGVTYKDHNGLDKTVTVTKGNLSTALRSDFAVAGVKTLQTLLPGVLMENPNALFDPIVTRIVRLPNGWEYHFFYTEWGELARIEMPGGGVIEYDYAGGLVTGLQQVYRYVTAKRVLSSSGNLEARQAFTYSPASNTLVTVKTYDATGVVVSSERHTFIGNVGDDFYFTGFYQPFDHGRELISEMLNTTDATVLRRIDNTWNTLDLNGAPTTQPQNALTHPTNLDCALTAVKTTLSDTNQAAKSTSTYDGHGHKTDTYDYDFGTAGSGSIGGLLRRTHTDFNYDSAYTANAGPYILNMVSRQWVSSDANGTNRLTQTEFEYDNYGTLPLVSRASISGSCIRLNDTATGCLQASDSFYTLRGNLSKTIAYYDISSSGTIINTSQYDVAGNVVKTIDARGYPTTFDYDDSFGPPDGNARGNSSPQELSLAGQYSYAFPTLVTNTLGHTAFTQFNYYIGAPVDKEDANGAVTSLYYENVLDRLTKISLPDGGRTTYTYVDSHQCGRYVETRTLLDTTGRETDSWQFFDGLGRPYLVESLDNQDPNNPYLRVDTQYDSMGRAWRVSSPYRSVGCTSTVNPSGRWTQTTFDALSRPGQIRTTADNAVVTTSYTGNIVTVTDQHVASSPGHSRKSVTNALGMLTAVYEDPTGANYLTSYTYDAMGNLRKVDQGGQQRFFMYDSLSRLIRAKNPEQSAGSVASNMTDPVTGNTQWSMAYGYDNNGNRTARVDARDVTTSYAYDALNRNTTVRYPDGTKDVDRYYDNPTANKNGLGRFWYTNWDQNNNTRFDSHVVIDEYDVMGRPKNYRQHFFTNGVASPQFNTTRTYDKAGEVLSQTYPSGHTVNYSYDIAGRLASYSGNLGDGVARTYSTGVIYSEFGGMQQEQFGTQTPLYHKLHYNVRGQLNDIRLSNSSWASDQWNWNRGAIVNYYATADLSCQTNECRANSGPDNNGNIRQSQYWIPTNDQMNGYNWTEDRYSYDYLNRLQTVAEYHGSSASGLGGQDFAQVYDCDRWGNRTINSGTWGLANTQFDKADAPYTNRLYAPGDTAIPTMSQRRIQYDAAGNQIYDSYTGQGARTYDAENHMKQAWANNQWQTYTYDAAGRRIKRNINGVETWQLYGMDGELLAEYGSGAAPFLVSKEYGYRGGELLVTMSSGDVQRLKRFVKNAYYNALGRDPSATESQQQVDTLALAGSQGQSQLLTTAKSLARGLFQSSEYISRNRTDSQYVTDIYNSYLQRGPDTGGLNFWVSNTQDNGRAATLNAFEVCTEFATLASTLYGTASGGDTQRVEHFVQGFYFGALQREPTSAEMQQQTQRLNNGDVVTEAQAIGREIFQTTNYNSSHTDQQYVTDLYEAFLQRVPDGPGLNYWVSNTQTNGRAVTLTAFQVSTEYQELAGTLYCEAYWLVTDHLGTPRMSVNRNGSLSSMKRHDYLPFGEQLSAGNGGRTTTQGYTTDSVRQKFTSKERDSETGLDWFGPGRYYAQTQGRFTSIDPLGASAKTTNPQTWNRFAYVLNRPTIAIDPDGLSTIVVVVSPVAAPQATVMVFDRGGHDVAVRNGSNRMDGTATGQGRNREVVRNDTPYGVYRIAPNHMGSNANGTQGGTAGVSARGADLRFGTGIVTMEPVSGEAFNARGQQVRDQIYIHGGGRPLTNALDPQQPLTPTEGCVRIHNEDVNALISTVNNLSNNGDPISNIFIGDVPTLNAQGDQRDRQGNYLYPELRQAGFGSPDAQGNPAGNRPAAVPQQQPRH
jgi:RHS repeat-associated protein